MNSEIEKIYKDIDTILLKHKIFNDRGMVYALITGRHGFKRFHKKLTKKFFCWHLELENEIYNKYRISFESEYNNDIHKPLDLRDHLKTWDAKLREDLENLGALNNKYRLISGKGNDIIEEVIECMVHDYEKTGRWINRFEKTNWAEHDIMEVDQYLHTKYKLELNEK